MRNWVHLHWWSNHTSARFHNWRRKNVRGWRDMCPGLEHSYILHCRELLQRQWLTVSQATIAQSARLRDKVVLCRQCLWYNWTLRIISQKLCSWLLLPRWSILEHANFLSLRCGIQMSILDFEEPTSPWEDRPHATLDLSLLNHFWNRATIVMTHNLLMNMFCGSISINDCLPCTLYICNELGMQTPGACLPGHYCPGGNKSISTDIV